MATATCRNSGPSLGSWVNHQRKQKKALDRGEPSNKGMTAARAARLDQLGFNWAPGPAGSSCGGRRCPAGVRHSLLRPFRSPEYRCLCAGKLEKVYIVTQHCSFGYLRCVGRGRSALIFAPAAGCHDPGDLGAQGLVIWGSTRNGTTDQPLWHSVLTRDGPMVQHFLARANACSEAHCGGPARGRFMPTNGMRCQCYAAGSPQGCDA
jgi:hypothetical protein